MSAGDAGLDAVGVRSGWPKRHPFLCAALVTLALAGCQPFSQPESLFDEYVRRVARVLDGEAELKAPGLPPELPRRRERARAIAPIEVSMLDFLGLYGCELQHVIGERNSSLGKVMHPAYQLDYELRFLVSAEACMARLSDGRLRDKLGAVIVHKRAALPNVVWNAVWLSPEIENLFTRSRGPLDVDADQNAVSELAQGLTSLVATLARIEAGDLGVDFKRFDSLYRRWQVQPTAGQLLRSAVLSARRLEDAALIVESRLGDRPLCHKGQGNRQAEITRSMFLSVYIGHVQPYIASVQRSRQALLPQLRALAELPGGVPDGATEDYAMQVLGDQGVWAEFDQAVRRHTIAWQRLLEQCGMRPGQAAAGAQGGAVYLAARNGHGPPPPG